MNNSEKDLTVYPVKIDDENMDIVDKYPLPPIPFFLVILGRVKAGKSNLLNNLTLSPRFYGNDFQIKILISPTLHDPINKNMVEQFDFVFEEYSEPLLNEIIDMIENDENDNRYLLVLYDAITTSFKQSKNGKVDAFSSLVTRYRHISNLHSGKESRLSIILTLQYFKFLTPITRTMAMGLCICGELSDLELKKISESYDFFGGNSKRFLEIYKKTKREHFDFCFLNVDSMEMRRNFDEIVYSKKDELEKEKKELERNELEN